MRILVVEDGRALANTLADLLGRERYLADIAYGGGAGLDCAVSGIYDGMALDVMLPKLDGFQVLRRLRPPESRLQHLRETDGISGEGAAGTGSGGQGGLALTGGAVLAGLFFFPSCPTCIVILQVKQFVDNEKS